MEIEDQPGFKIMKARLNYLMGQVMRKMPNANPKLVREVLIRKLNA